MALQIRYSKQDEIPKADAHHYKKVEPADGDAYWLLDAPAQDGWEVADTRSLLSSLETERKAGRALKRYGEITPERAKEQAERLAALEEENERLKESTKGNSGDKWKAREDELQRLHAEELRKEREKATGLLGQLDDVIGKQSALAELEANGFKEAAKMLLPHVIAQIGFTDENGKRRSFVKRDDGSPRLVQENGEAREMSVGDLVKSMASSADYKRWKDAPVNAPKPTANGNPAPGPRTNTDPNQRPAPYNAARALGQVYAKTGAGAAE
jgi:hypothetical protein